MTASPQSSGWQSSGWPVGPRAHLRDRIAELTRPPESHCVPPLIDAAALSPAQSDAARALALDLIAGLRAKHRHEGLVDGLMHEFSLSTQEGIALMCLAEALLRIPDQATRDALIRDKMAKGDWQSHLGHSSSFMVNAATWGMVITGRLASSSSQTSLTQALTRLIAKGGEPLIARGVDLAMRMMGRHFVMGQTIEEALENTRGSEARGFRYSYDMLGEAASTADDALGYFHAYEQAIHAIGQASNGRGVIEGPGISIKLSALHPRYCRAQKSRVMAEMVPAVAGLAQLARRYDIGLTIDAEESDRLDLSLDILETLCANPALKGWSGLGLAVQAYQKRAPAVLDYLIDLARSHDRRLMVRLVKGAYWDGEIKRAQIDGQTDFPVFTRKVHTDVSYLACARRMLAAPDAIFPQFATHNAQTLAAIHVLAGSAAYEFQCLHGMGEPLYDEVLASARLSRPCRIYAPVGSHETLLAYLVRRLLENGANSSFVNRIADPSLPATALAADPVEQARSVTPLGAPHPGVALPRTLFGVQRPNSIAPDLTDEDSLAQLARCFGTAPADFPPIPEVSPADIEDALARAEPWQAPPSERGRCLRAAADLIEGAMPALLPLLAGEAGKTLANAVGEVREAVDFLRYYAAQAEARLAPSTRPLGVVAAISPWNFPLAIFTGQVAAALAGGNAVLAKPAPETPRIAQAAVDLLHRAGVPTTALRLLPGGGATGTRLVADARIQGVLFTGSTASAKFIQHALAGRLGPTGRAIPLIAETGGINAMIADSSARPEQVVADVVTSAFDSAGQRCSALRLLCLQNDVADTVLDILAGAIDQLIVGDPRHLSTDIGPVIGPKAKAMIEDHIDAMRARGFACHHNPLPRDLPPHAAFVAPTVIEVSHPRDVCREVFGPVLHVLRYDPRDLVRVIDEINASGFGLTFGIHSRIDETIARATARIRAGNIYVNRSMIGATVGVQPFGGRGLSGTGPKAGGPLYLDRLVIDALPLPLPAPPPPPAQAQSWCVWLDGLGQREAAQRCRAAIATSRLGVEIDLPGPVGERNTYSLVPRGAVLCLGRTTTGLLSQIGAALATGNRALAVQPPDRPDLLDDLPGTLLGSVETVTDWRRAPFDAVLVEGGTDALQTTLITLAENDGPIVPVQCAEDGVTGYRLEWLLAERSVSTNTAATGGNAQLMTLALE